LPAKYRFDTNILRGNKKVLLLLTPLGKITGLMLSLPGKQEKSIIQAERRPGATGRDHPQHGEGCWRHYQPMARAPGISLLGPGLLNKYFPVPAAGPEGFGIDHFIFQFQ
jgi:hypothetical protein